MLHSQNTEQYVFLIFLIVFLSRKQFSYPFALQVVITPIAYFLSYRSMRYNMWTSELSHHLHNTGIGYFEKQTELCILQDSDILTDDSHYKTGISWMFRQTE